MTRRTALLFGLILIILIASTAFFRNSESSSYWIVYSAINGNWHQNLYRVHVLSGTVRPITDNDLEEGQPELIGQDVIFHAFSRPVNFLYRVKLTGSQRHLIASNVSTKPAATSERGILFTDVKNRLICYTDDHTIVLAEDRVNSFAWSPDTEWVSFTTIDDEERKYRLYRMRPDGTEREFLAQSNRIMWHTRWSPDGERIGYISNDVIYLYHLATGNTTRLFGGLFINDYTWSPDGQQIAFSTYHNAGYTQTDIYRVDIDGENVVELSTHPDSEYNLAWSPDGEWLAFTANYNDNTFIYRMRAEGGETQQLTTSGLLNFSPRWIKSEDHSIHSWLLLVGAMALLVMWWRK
jgi:Tol biopolymer transport system component